MAEILARPLLRFAFERLRASEYDWWLRSSEYRVHYAFWHIRLSTGTLCILTHTRQIYMCQKTDFFWIIWDCNGPHHSLKNNGLSYYRCKLLTGQKNRSHRFYFIRMSLSCASTTATARGGATDASFSCPCDDVVVSSPSPPPPPPRPLCPTLLRSRPLSLVYLLITVLYFVVLVCIVNWIIFYTVIRHLDCTNLLFIFFVNKFHLVLYSVII